MWNLWIQFTVHIASVGTSFTKMRFPKTTGCAQVEYRRARETIETKPKRGGAELRIVALPWKSVG